MECTSELDEESGICTLSVRGDFVRPKDAFEIERITADLYVERRCRLFLVDMTDARIVARTMDTFDSSNPPAELRVALRKVRVASLYPELTEDHRFLEDVAVNRGFQLRVFDNRNKAVNWLA